MGANLTRQIGLRRVPYPYRAIMAITNDVDEASWDDFVLLHDFMNSTRPTRLGQGLDLEVGDSFFFYATTADSKAPTFSYFEGCDPERRAPWAEQMDRLIDAGYLDCLHTWGDFSRTGGFRRELAESAARTLLQSQGKVSVWINHGDSRNEQMAGRPGWDDASTPHGHADLAIGSGLRYFWTGSLTSVVGQNASDTWSDRLDVRRLREDFIRPLKQVVMRAPGIVKFFRNRLMMPASVCGQEIQVFQRHGYWEKPTAVDLPEILAPEVLDRLESREGCMALYTHLFRRPRGTSIGQMDWSPLVEVARRHHSGRIKVTTTARLLRYVESYSRVEWEPRRFGGDLEIHLRHPDSLDALQGLTFYVPDAQRTAVFLQGEAVRVQSNAPDHTGRPSVSLPWRALVYPPS